MKKIRLDLDTLAVESFNTTAAEEEKRGTVHGHRPPVTEGLECESIDWCQSDYGTCATNCGSCGATDCGTCYDPSCCPTYCGTCDPYCCCTCSCY